MLRDYIRVIARSKTTYFLRYFNFHNEARCRGHVPAFSHTMVLSEQEENEASAAAPAK